MYQASAPVSSQSAHLIARALAARFTYAQRELPCAAFESRCAIRLLLPGVSAFLDVDNLDNPDHIERYIDESQTVIIFLSKGYFFSENCLRELDHAMAQGKRLIIVHDPDVSHGGATMESLRAECESKKRMQLFEADDDTDADSEDDVVETERKVVTWQRLNDYQVVAVKEICAEMLHAMPEFEKSDSPPEIYVPGDLSSQAFTFEQKIKVHVSPHNPGAWALAEDFQAHCLRWNAKRGDLMKKSKTLEIKEGTRAERTTSPPPSPPDIEVPMDNPPPKGSSRRLSFPNPLNRSSSSARRFSFGPMLKGWGTMTDLDQNVTVHHVWATHFLLLLNKHTFVGEEGQLLAAEVQRALDSWLPIVLAHEEDPERDGCPFDQLYHSTPEVLINRGLYKKAAISCVREPLRSVSFSLIAKAVGAVPVQTRFAELAHSPGKAVRRHRSPRALT